MGVGMQKIAVWRTVGAAYAFVFGHPLRLLRLGGIWLAVIAGFELWLVLSHNSLWLAALRSPTWAPVAQWAFPLSGIAELLFFALGLISLCVALHRAALAHETRSWFAALRFGRREWRFLGYTLLIGLAMAVPIFVVNHGLLNVGFAALRGGANLGVVLQWWYLITITLLLLVWSYASRLMLVFPAVAVDDTGEALLRAWDRSRGNWLRLYFGSLICMLPFTVADWYSRALLGPKMVAWTRYQLSAGISVKLAQGGELHDAFSAALSLLDLCVLVVFYSCCYRQLASSAEAAGAVVSQTAPA